MITRVLGVLSDTALVARFLVVGLGNTILGLGVIFAARQFVPDLVANAIGYLIVVPVSFWTHRDISFRDRGSRLGAFLRYLPTIGAGYAGNLLILTTAMSLGVDGYIAQTSAIAGHVLITFVLSHLFVFLNFNRGQHGSTPPSVCR